jgi:8-oxo-dGTP pyrophosphatase MutT (NUDIX family)
VQLLRKSTQGRGGLKPVGKALSEERIKNLLEAGMPHQPQSVDDDTENLTKAAVLIPLLWDEDEWHLLYIRRAEMLKTHKGQVAFPGGQVDDVDSDRIATAMRETFEEIGIPSHEVTILGSLPEVATPSGYLITPVVGQIPWPYQLRISPDEVSRVFTIPLAWLANPENSQERSLKLLGNEVSGVVFFQPYDGELLWGITARITKNFLLTVGLLASS